MKRTLAILLALGMLAAVLAAPATAAKKKPKLVKSELTLFLRWDAGSADCDGPTYLSSEEGENPGNGCTFIFQGAQELLTATGQEPLSRDWPAQEEDVPFKLDTSRPIEGHMVIRGHVAPQAHLEVEVGGNLKNDFKALGSYRSDDYMIISSGTTGPVEVHFEIEVENKKLNKKSFSSLNLNTAIRGVQAVGYIDLDAPSYITIPVWVKKN